MKMQNTHIKPQQISAVRRSLLHRDHASVAMDVEIWTPLFVGR